MRLFFLILIVLIVCGEYLNVIVSFVVRFDLIWLMDVWKN